MTELLLVRHGETTWNHDRRMQGQTDIPLSDFGRGQARRLADRLERERLVAAYASDLSRAWETATIALGGRDVPLNAEPRLREVHLGDWQGHTIAELQEIMPDELKRVWGDRVDAAPRGGESRRQLQDRMVAAIRSIAECHPTGRVLVVAHGGALRTLGSWVVAGDLRHNGRFEVDNCSISRIDIEGDEPTLRCWNDTSHLQGLIDPEAGDWRVV
jgi:broad specificity phosphatase PhoE